MHACHQGLAGGKRADGAIKSKHGRKVGDQAETVKPPLTHRLDSAGTTALLADVRLVMVPVRIWAEALQQEIDESAHLRRQVPGRQVDGVYVLLHGNVLGQDRAQPAGLDVGADDEGGQQGEAQAPSTACDRASSSLMRSRPDTGTAISPSGPACAPCAPRRPCASCSDTEKRWRS